ncbi:MAG: tubulin-like doman-containing protein [Capsulimonadaceae bacterium]
MSKNHVIIGLGGTGGKIIRAFRKTIYQEFRQVDPPDVNLGYLYVDSSDEMMNPQDATWRILGRSVQLGNASQLLITDANLQSRLENINNYPGIKDWIGSQEEWSNILRSIVGVTLGGQKRRLGRFLFACKADQFKQQLRNQVREVQTKGEIPITFHICVGLAGGTGSGSIVDAIAQIRDTYPDAKTYKVIVYALLPDRYPKPNWDTGNYHANGYAALMELNALSVGAYRPHDVTGVKGRLEMIDPFNGCYVFSNENENGLFVDVESDIPNIVANFLYQKLIAVRNVAWDTLRRMESAENGDGTPEMAPDARQGERSKRFLTFGIKRLAIPEEEIREYLTYSFARQASLQLQFNNWSDALSFADEPRNQSYTEYVKQSDVLNRWLISDDHLRLSVGILQDEIKNPRWQPINQTWNDILPHFKSFIRENYASNAKVWLDELQKLCEKRYGQEYRELGVQRFYETKEGDRKDHLREIILRISKDLIEDWRNGVKSMQDIRRLLDALSADLGARLLTIDDKIVVSQRNDEACGQKVLKNLNEWAHMNLLVAALGKRDQLFDAQAATLQELYTYRTNTVAWKFGKALLQSLIGEITSLQSDVDVAAQMIAGATETFNKALGERLTDQGQSDLRQQLVKFYDPDAVKTFTRAMVKDKDQQIKQTKAFRDELLSQLGDSPTFSTFNQRITRERFLQLLETKSEESAKTAHDIMATESKDRGRLLGDSIIEKLYAQFGGNLDAVNKYVRDLVGLAGNYVAFKSEEISKTGEGIPAGVPTKITNFTVIMPLSATRPDFYNTLRDAFKASSTVSMDFIPSPQTPSEVKPNEITLVSVTNLFPLRYLDQTSFLKEKYDTRLGGTNTARARLEIHGEGDGTQFPPIYVPTMSQVKDQGLPYVMIAVATNLITPSKNPATGASAYVLITKDADGLDNDPVYLGADLVDSVNKLDSTTARIVTKATTDLLAGPDYTTADQRVEVQKNVVAMVEKLKADRGGNVQDATYRRFLDAAKKAVSILKREA